MTTESPADQQRTRFLLINLLLLVVVILCLSAAILVYRRAQAPAEALAPSATLRPSLTPSPSFTASLTPSITPTPLPTLSPTPSLTPTWTPPPSQTPTPTSLPTLVPFRPAANAGIYSLREWTPEDASYMIALMQGYPDTLPASARGEDQSAYYAAFEYAVTAARESLLFFPDADEAREWQWALAYNLALTGSSEAGQEYADLIVAGLNSGETDLDLLYFWFEQHEPRQSLHMVEIDPPSGYLAAYVIELNDRQGGGAFIWLLHSSSGYRAYPILSAYDFVQPRHAAWIISELNNDSTDGDELAIYFSALPEQFHLEPPLVYNLARIPARSLPSLPDLNDFNVGMEYNNYWAVRPNDLGGNDLLFKSDIYAPCPIAVRRAYRWNGAYFEFVEASYTLDNPPLELGYCDFIAAHASAYWGPDAGAAIMETLLPDWPPPQDAQGQPYPADALDEWRYRLGVNYALLGELQAARQAFQTIVDEPATHNSRWIQPAQDFLEVYQAPEDVYRACIGAQFCEPYYAIQYLVANLPGGQDPLTYLQSAGLNTFATGYFDFDYDQVRERWFTLRHQPLQALEFWILAVHPAGVSALYVANVDSQTPSLAYLDPAYIHPDSLYLQPVVFLDSRVAFSMQRAPETLLPYLVDVTLREVYPNRFEEGLKAAEAALFSGASPEQVHGDLLSLAIYPGLLCKGDWSCDEYYYMLGLSSQLAGDETGAVEAYHKLWSDYLRSPYTSMARLKLDGGVTQPTPTATFTFTPTSTASLTVTLSGTLTPSLTPTPTVTGTPPTLTPTLSPTVTTTGTTPQPSSTPTPTATTGGYPGPATNTVAPTTYP